MIEESGVNYTYEQLRKMVSATSVNSTGLFRVTVTSSNPEEARALANVIASILPFDNLTKLTMVFSEAFPCAVTTSAITLQSRKNDQLAAEGITLTTIFSLVTLPIVASLLMYLYM